VLVGDSRRSKESIAFFERKRIANIFSPLDVVQPCLFGDSAGCTQQEPTRSADLSGDAGGDRKVAISATRELPGHVRGDESYEIWQSCGKSRAHAAAQTSSKGIPQRRLMSVLGRDHRIADPILVRPQRDHAIELKLGTPAVQARFKSISLSLVRSSIPERCGFQTVHIGVNLVGNRSDWTAGPTRAGDSTSSAGGPHHGLTER
jgi:hypothetical protein